MTSLSLKWRISLWTSAVLISVIATISIVAYIEFDESHLINMDRTLLAMANGIAASLDDFQGTEELMKKVHAVTGRPGWNPSICYRIWMDGSSTDLLASDTPNSRYGSWLRELQDQNSPSPGEPIFVNLGLPHDEYRAVWIREKIDGGTANIVVAGPSHHTYHETYEFQRLLIVLGGSLILGSVVAVMWTVRCGLRPIDNSAKRLKDITYPNVGEVILDDKKVPKELRPFAEALNDMLGRLNKILRQQKQFTSDAAHELRTPLALAKSTLQVAQMNQKNASECKQVIADVLNDIARMEYITEQLLILARMDETNEHIATEEVQLDVLLSELAENYNKKIEHTGGKVIIEKPPATTVGGNLDELLRLFSNVIDNSTKYGPSNGTVRITLEHDSDRYATVRVHDEGGNIPSAALPHVFDRFYRVDQSRSRSTGGAGLGLAIAREIARRHNGDISITSNPTSGTLVCIRLARN
jgi:signal transduction histidine kinase